MFVFNKDVCVLAFLGPHDLNRGGFQSAAISMGELVVVGLLYAIAEVCLFKVISFVTLSKVCEMVAMTICVRVLTTPKYCADAIQTVALLYQAPFDVKALLAGQLLNALLRWA